MKKILIVEDEKEIRNILKVYLLTAGYEVTEAADGEEAMRIFYEKPFDLVVLDIMLPKKDGWSICREIKEYSSVPVIIITARDNENDEVFGFEIGADDYIIKPFSINVLSTKIKKYLKLNIQQEYLYKDMEYSFKDEILKIKNERVNLSTREQNLLEYFIKNRNKPLSRNNILLEIWGIDNEFDERASDTLVKRLRKKLGDYEELIGTVRGVGYIFEER